MVERKRRESRKEEKRKDDLRMGAECEENVKVKEGNL